MKSKPTIAIVGAGLAGLTAAYRLHQQGFDVRLFEARFRLGGRVLSVKLNGKIAEIGGHNITDGGAAKNMLKLIQDLKLDLIKEQWNMNILYYNGEKFIPFTKMMKDLNLDPQELKQKLQKLAAQSKSIQEILGSLYSENDVVYKVVSTSIASYEGATVDKLSTFYVETLYHMLLGGISHAHPTSDEEDAYIHLASIKGGNSLLPEKIGEVLGERVHLGCALNKLSKTDRGEYHLAFQNGQIANADIVVLALPCTMYAGIEIDPGVLSEEKKKSIEKVQYGLNAKILLANEASEKQIGALTNGRMVSFYGCNRQSITMYYNGELSRFTKDNLQRIFSEDVPFIAKAHDKPGLAVCKPVLANDLAFSSYEGAVAHSWSNDPYIRGSYTCIAPGQEETFTSLAEYGSEKVKKLFMPIDGRLFFAGEHASILLDVAGTMEAAVESGERTARMIMHNQH